MEFNENDTFSFGMQQRLDILEILTRSGPIRIGQTGAQIKKIIYLLRDSELADENRLTIQSFFEQFRNLIRQHKEYILFNREIGHTSIELEQKINLLTEKFTILDETTTHLKQEVNGFLSQNGFEMQQNQLVALPQQQLEIVGAEIENLEQSNEIQAQEHVVEDEREPSFSQVESTTFQEETLENEDVSSEIQAQEHVVKDEREPSFSQVESTTFQEETLENEDVSSVFTNGDLQRQTTICELTVPLQINSIKRLQPKVFSKWIVLQPELQLHYLKTAAGQNQFFIGINCNFNLDLSNLKKLQYQKSQLVGFRTLNSIIKIYKFRTTNNSKFTVSIGRILKVKNEEIGISTNFALNNTTLKKENLSFQIEYKTRPLNIACKHQSYLTFQQTTCYEFFPYKNNLMLDFGNLNKKKKNLPTANKTLNIIETEASYAGTTVTQPSPLIEIENSAVTAALRTPSKPKQYASVSLAPPVASRNPDSLAFGPLALAVVGAVLVIREFFGKHKS